MLVNSSSSFLIRTFIFLFHIILKDNTCRVRAFQCVKSTKMDIIFSPDSHSLFQFRQKNAKNCHFEAFFEVTHSLRSFFMYFQYFLSQKQNLIIVYLQWQNFKLNLVMKHIDVQAIWSIGSVILKQKLFLHKISKGMCYL